MDKWELDKRGSTVIGNSKSIIGSGLACTHKHGHTYTQACTHAHTHIHTHVHTHMDSHWQCTHTHTHGHKHRHRDWQTYRNTSTHKS